MKLKFCMEINLHMLYVNYIQGNATLIRVSHYTGTNIQLSIAINADNIRLSRSKINPDNIVTNFLSQDLLHCNKHLTEYCSVSNCHVTLLSRPLITVYTSCFSACYQGLIM